MPARPRFFAHRPSPTIRALALLVSSVVLLAACSSSDSQATSVEDFVNPDIADVQPTGPAGDLDVDVAAFDGSTVNLMSYQGRPVVINFFARSCAACVAEMPDFEQVFNDYDGEVAFVGVSTDPRAEDALLLIEQTAITYDTLWDPDSKLFFEFGGLAMPTTVIADSTGTVVERFSGATTATDLKARVDAVLEG